MRALLVVTALLSLPLLAQDAGPDGGAPADAGVVDAGAPVDPPDAGVDPCTPRCEGDTLRFCDQDTPVTRDCADEGAICGELSPAWGADCLLPEGAACEPGYGDDLSACEGASAGIRCCIDDTCQSAGGADCRDFAPARPDLPGPATGGPIEPSDDLSTTSCLDCQNANLAWLFPLALFRWRRRTS
jgi:hypothetical protein